MSDEYFKVGQRVRICPVKPPARQPHPEHEGKEGVITGEENVMPKSMKPFYTPIITLDDGTILSGTDCWWEQV